MEFKALITNQITFGDEAIRVNIEKVESIDELKSLINEALTFCDYRRHELGFRLFEDTDLIATLSEEELAICETAARLLYPKIELTPSFKYLSQGEVKLEFSKNTATGESIVLQIHNPDKQSSVVDAVKAVWDILDTRLIEANMRQIEHMSYLKSKEYNSMLKAVMVMDILYGRTFIESVVQRLKSNNEDSYVQDQIAQATQARSNGSVS